MKRGPAGLLLYPSSSRAENKDNFFVFPSGAQRAGPALSAGRKKARHHKVPGRG